MLFIRVGFRADDSAHQKRLSPQRWRQLRLVEEKTNEFESVCRYFRSGQLGSARRQPWPINGIKKPTSPSTKPSRFPERFCSPGKYVMKLADSQSNRHIVQIFNEREDQLQTTVLRSRIIACSQPGKPSSNGGKHRPDSPKLSAHGSIPVTTLVKSSRIPRPKLSRSLRPLPIMSRPLMLRTKPILLLLA